MFLQLRLCLPHYSVSGLEAENGLTTVWTLSPPHFPDFYALLAEASLALFLKLSQYYTLERLLQHHEADVAQ